MGPVQLGIFAAFVVLFFPMAMAGWHLNRNKILLFSGALFITLAVFVHLTPYVPPVSNVLTSISSVISIENKKSCISFLHDISWEKNPGTLGKHPLNYSQLWSWSKSASVAACGFQKLHDSDALDLLNGSWVVVAGDSQARLFVLSLLNLILDSSDILGVQEDLFKRHSDYEIVIKKHGIKVNFIWAPYVTNLTDFVDGMRRENQCPNVLVLGSGLWHMLHFTDSSDYGVSLKLLRESINLLLSNFPDFGKDEPDRETFSNKQPHMFWLGMPTLINSMLNTDEKREKMNQTVCEAYNRKFYESGLLRMFGGPFLLLDIGKLSRNCGSLCTDDGMHYNESVYDAALHVMLNSLLIESQQQI